MRKPDTFFPPSTPSRYDDDGGFYFILKTRFSLPLLPKPLASTATWFVFPPFLRGRREVGDRVTRLLSSLILGPGREEGGKKTFPRYKMGRNLLLEKKFAVLLLLPPARQPNKVGFFLPSFLPGDVI